MSEDREKGSNCNLIFRENTEVNPTNIYKYSLDVVTSITSKAILQMPQRQQTLKVNGRKCRKNRISQISLVVESNNVANVRRSQLSYCGHDCRKIPPVLGKMYGLKAQCLDLSFNSLISLQGLEAFHEIEELILDNNQLSDNISLPTLKKLTTLSLNNNQIVDLERIIMKIASNLPSLTYLSLLSNRACPNQLSDKDKDDNDYQRYRFYVLHHIPKLKFLDSRRVMPWERREALTRGHLMTVRRPKEQPVGLLMTCGDYLNSRVTALPSTSVHKGAYGKYNFKYTGKHSEGNRFIVNNDL